MYLDVEDGFNYVEFAYFFARHFHVVVGRIVAAENHHLRIGMAAQVLDHAEVVHHYNIDLAPEDAGEVGNGADGHKCTVGNGRGHRVAVDAHYYAVAPKRGDVDRAYDAVGCEFAAQLKASGGHVDIVDGYGVGFGGY